MTAPILPRHQFAVLAGKAFLAVEIQHGAVQRAAVGLDAAHHDEGVGVGRGLGHHRDFLAVQADGLLVIAGEGIAAFGLAHADGRAEGIALRVAAQEGFGEHQHARPLLCGLADQGGGLVGAGQAVGEGVSVDGLGAGVRQEQAADDAHHHHHDHRIHQTAEDIAACLRQVRRSERHDPAEDAGADVIREG
ncbi:hypothetical protein G6F31_016739 [Rhizopus arrhizus]|nr:hypothetical protein G6F31_016739 [Rhizopus arrhizus]